VHRDFKPGNVMVDDSVDRRDPRVRVLDFGLAREGGTGEQEEGEALSVWRSSSASESSGELRPAGTELTRPGTVLGTPAYMAPEQFGGRRVGAPADQFAFCVVVYRLL